MILVIVFKILKKFHQSYVLLPSPTLWKLRLLLYMYVQMELIELKNDEQLLNKFRRQKDLLEIWKDTFQYPNMQLLARETLVLFGSTYVCEAAFSSMKYLKNSYRTRLLDKNLEAELRLIVSREIPNFQSLSSAIQNQSSH